MTSLNPMYVLTLTPPSDPLRTKEASHPGSCEGLGEGDRDGGWGGPGSPVGNRRERSTD